MRTTHLPHPKLHGLHSPAEDSSRKLKREGLPVLDDKYVQKVTVVVYMWTKMEKGALQ